MRKIFALMAAIVLLTSCGVNPQKYENEVKKVDSLTKVNAKLQEELDGYRYSPSMLLAAIQEDYRNHEYAAVKTNLDKLKQYHRDAAEYIEAQAIYEQGLKEQAEAQRKAEAEAKKREAERRAKMSKIEKLMEKYDCDEETARAISKGQVQMGMTTDQARAAWGRPRDINRSVGSYGVHEQWCYDGCYLYFENGVLTSWQN